MEPCLPTGDHGWVHSTMYMFELGIGKGIWTFPLDKLDDFFPLIYVESIRYIFAIGVVKISLVVCPLLLGETLQTILAVPGGALGG
jgi:hypothetical protein